MVLTMTDAASLMKPTEDYLSDFIQSGDLLFSIVKCSLEAL